MIIETMKQRVTEAMKSGDKETALTLRSLVATLHNEKIKLGKDLTEDDAIKVLKTEVKKRDEAFESYEQAGREESAANEKREKELILSFLPAQMDEAELSNIIDAVIAEADDKNNFGLLMKSVMAKVGPAADGGTVSKLLKEKL